MISRSPLRFALLLAIAAFSSLTTLAQIAQPTASERRIQNLRYRLSIADGQPRIAILWHTNFAAERKQVVVSASAKTGAGESAPPMTLEEPRQILEGIVAKATDFQAWTPYGAGGLINDVTDSLTIRVAIRDAAAGNEVASESVAVDMDTAKTFYSVQRAYQELLVSNNVLKEQCNKPVPVPVIDASARGAETSITVTASVSDAPVEVRAFAFSSTVPSGVPPEGTPASDPTWLYPGDGVTRPLRISGLKSAQTYKVVVREVGTPLNRKAVIGNPITIDATTSGALTTLPAAKPPSVVFDGDIQIHKGTTLKASVRVRNARFVQAKVYRFDEKQGSYVQPAVKTHEIELAAPLSADDNESRSTVLEIPFDTSPGVRYQLALAAYGRYGKDGFISATEVKPVIGLPERIAQTVTMTFTKDGIEFAADTVGVKAQLEVVARTSPNGSFTYTNAPAANPKFLLPLAQLGSPAPGTGISLTIGVKAEDGTEREQKQALTIKIAADDAKSSKNKDSARVAINEFGTALRAQVPDERKKLSVGNVLLTGAGALLKFLLPGLP